MSSNHTEPLSLWFETKRARTGSLKIRQDRTPLQCVQIAEEKLNEKRKEAEEIRRELNKRAASMKRITYEDLKRRVK